MQYDAILAPAAALAHTPIWLAASPAAGKNVCILVGAACAGLALATGRAARAGGKGVRGVVALGVAAVRFNAMMALLGVAHHTGQVGRRGRGRQGMRFACRSLMQ